MLQYLEGGYSFIILTALRNKLVTVLLSVLCLFHSRRSQIIL